jgi:hypothetical protein
MHAARSRFGFVAALALAAAPWSASAEDGWSSRGDAGLLTPVGEYVLFGGGVSDFTDDAVKDRYDIGGAWDLRLGLGSRFYVGGEVAYVGSAQRGEGSTPDLLSNGAEGVLRLQYPYVRGEWLVEPFAFGGIGWRRLSLQDAPAGLKDSDDVGVVPFGAGVTLGHGRFLVDARFTYRTSFDEDLAFAAGERPANLEQWAVGASLGYEF